MEQKTVTPSQFYANDIYKHEVISLEKTAFNASCYKNGLKRMTQHIMGPTQFWQQFHKQADALDVARKFSSASDTLCTFVYQKDDGFREFIVAHPEVYWYYSMLPSPEQRCSYEVIPEGSPCWLYFDLEFLFELNPDKNGPRMTATLIKIVCAYLLKYWGLPCDETNVVNLDSTTNIKFSRHLIFCMKDIAFFSNLHVGRFVKSICREIDEYLENSTVAHDILSQYERKILDELIVDNGKKKKLFIDLAVYSRNRHFRTYKSTKSGKMSHLIVAAESKHMPLREYKDKDLAIFLDSLISYFPNKKDLVLLEMDIHESVNAECYTKCQTQRKYNYGHSSTTRYPDLDKFILSIIKPGKIRICKHFEGSKMIIYEVIGNRFCGNIGRQHKSNNVFWIADLHKNCVYQKCHDEDCANFKSEPLDIPLEICFKLDDEYDKFFCEISLSNDEF